MEDNLKIFRAFKNGIWGLLHLYITGRSNIHKELGLVSFYDLQGAYT